MPLKRNQECHVYEGKKNKNENEPTRMPRVMDGWINGVNGMRFMDGWMDGRMYIIYIYICTYMYLVTYGRKRRKQMFGD